MRVPELDFFKCSYETVMCLKYPKVQVAADKKQSGFSLSLLDWSA